MGEYIRYRPDGEPYFPFTSKLGDVEADYENSDIYRHPFENRGVDHLFIALNELDTEVQGAFLIRAETEWHKPGVFDKIIGELIAHDWNVIECDEVSECDQKVFDRFVDNHVEKVTNKKIRKWLKDGERPSC